MKMKNVVAGMTAAVLVCLGGAAWGENILSATDKAFMKTVSEGNIAEVQLGKLVVQKASRPSTKNIARMIIRDHSRAQHDLIVLASQKKVSLPMAPNAKHRAMMAKLARMSGLAFDKAFLTAQLGEHRKVAMAFKSESNSNDSDLRSFVV